MADWLGQNSEAIEPLPVAAEEVEVAQELPQILANVNTIAIGLGNRNPDVSGQAVGSGTMYFDDIRLYPPPPEPAP
ncbi:MAG: hypothetical protein ACETWQ_18440 [Phycisphaerae bacterium]